MAIPIDELTRGEMDSQKQMQLHRLACHYGIFKDLFHGDHFFPQTSLTVLYEAPGQEAGADSQQDEEITFNPVFYGNVLDPSEVSKDLCKQDTR